MANESARPSRGVFLTVITVLFLLLALSDFTKALQFVGNPAVGGLVILGHKFHGVLHNLILGPIFGIVLLAYAYGIWNLRAWVLPLSIVYAFYVPVNMVLFWSLHQLPPPTKGFIVMYLFLSLTGSVGTAIYLSYHRERLS
ncbi:hypothetical protein [Candidatus Binatus sp.]|jgi:hypothetical protein|uniref:hypothetical protein n=1 Tax=Candidatus Binatus sp. TaxID=2811406 RepID=UPI003CC0266B